LSHFRLKSKLQRSVLHSPSTWVISKTTPRCVATFGKNSEKHHLPPLTIAITPLFCNTIFQLFFKNFCLSTADYHFFLAFYISPNATFLKFYPLQYGVSLFAPELDEWREISIYYCHLTGYIRILRLIMYSAKQSLK